MTTEELIGAYQAAVAAALAEDRDQVDTAVRHLDAHASSDQMQAVCAAVAEVGVNAMHLLFGPRDPDSMIAVRRTGHADDSVDPATWFAMRLLAARANDDAATVEALYASARAASREEHIASVVALLTYTSRLARIAIGFDQ